MSALKAIGLTSPTTQASGRFVFGEVFPMGAVPAGQYLHLDTPAYSAIVNNTWPDGSACMVAFTGTTAFEAGIEKQINIVIRSWPGVASTQTPLTAASIAASTASASIQFGSIPQATVFGTSTLAGATLVQTHYSDGQMVCCEYREKVSTTGLSAQYYVWLFADGKRLIRATPWNGFAFDGSVQRDYVPTVTIDGSVVFNNSGAVYYHSKNTWYTSLRWSAGAVITPRHDTAKLIESGLFPNYTHDVPQAANRTYCAAISNYVPGSNMGFTVRMESGGAHDDIGILPTWEAMYFVNRAEKVTYDALIANAHAIGMYGAFHTDPNTLRPIKLSDYPTYTQYGSSGEGGGNYPSIMQDNTTVANLEIAHSPSCSYTAYAVTADPFYMQTTQYIANACYLAVPYRPGQEGVLRIVGQQVRGVAWTFRSISQAARTCPDNQASYYEHNQWFSNQIGYYSGFADGIPGVGGFKVGLLDQSDNYGGNGYNGAGCPMWQHDFLMMSLGQALRMKVGTTPTVRAKVLNFFTYLANSIPWRTAYPWFTYGPNIYHVIPKSTPISDVSPLLAINANPASAADIWNANNLSSAEIATLGDNFLRGGGSTGTQTGSYWDQMLTALSYAVDFNIPGAAEGLARIKGASNYSTTLGAMDRATRPVFAISPLTVTHTPTFTAVDTGSGEIVPTPGPSLRVGAMPLHTDGFIVTSQPGIGTPGSQIAGTVTGADGTTSLADAIAAAGGTFNPLNEYRRESSSSNLFIDDKDLSEIYTGTGSYQSVPIANVENGVTFSTVSENFGTAPVGNVPTVTGVTATPTTASVAGGGTVQITTNVQGANSPSQAGTWTKRSGVGTMNSSSLYQAVAATISDQVSVFRFTSDLDNNYWAEVTITIPAVSDQNNLAPRFARPASDTTKGAWLASTGNNLSAMLDEATADSSDYIVATTATTALLALSPVQDPNTSTNQTVRYQAWSPTGGTLTVRLKQGSTVIATWTHSSLPTVPTLFAQPLTSAQCNAITDYTALSIELTAA